MTRRVLRRPNFKEVIPMADEPKDLMEEVEEDFELLDTVEY